MCKRLYRRFEKTNVTGENRYTFLVSTESVRADKVFFQVLFDSPVQDLLFETGGNFSRTRVPQVAGIFDEDFRLDPMSTKEIRFRVKFDPDYSTACAASVTCDDCDRFDPLCDGFVRSKIDGLGEVR